ncbi:cell division protein FtsA [Buchnera aphidicola (Muscaphis stroyani)]|uniref:Cell division protein FtsA n=1 Tax=Buchnera aphidicola (Muscaphis stroyani) TaxID=1241869 RepID=A0A4D6YCP9_9GAMM|nr:cell division protein FtsA [Buchnera aphidicola]QCI24301.1 cell division protein FtsA [Buchnera aphidicola (Muscaphis stroyani)]
MITSKDKKLVVALELGTTKVTTLVGEIIDNGEIKVIGIGTCSSKGMDKGRINNLDAVVKCIKKSINQAEITSNCQINSVYLSLSSKYINCQNEIGIVPIDEDEVTKKDIENVIHTAKSVQILNEHHILHVIPQEYSIDQQSGIKNPIGLSGMRMQVKVHIITCHHSIAKNMVKAVEKCGLKVDQVIFSGLASSKAVLTEDEKKLGVCMIDIGGGTMDFTIYINGSIQDSQVIPYAGNTVTSDIAYAFSASNSHAETIKIQYGSAKKSSNSASKNIDFYNLNGHLEKNVKQDSLIEVIESRYIELLSLVNQRIIHIQKKLYKNREIYQLSGGIVLTGGASNIELLSECAEKIFYKPVRIADPLNVSGLTEQIKEPSYSTTIGLLQYGKESYFHMKDTYKKYSFIESWIQKINNWFKKEF